MAQTTVFIVGNAYRVFLEGDLRNHLVKKTRECSCGEKDCKAILAVEDYLRKGGTRAPDPLPPCPICGEKVVRDPKLDGKYTHEPGWQCEEGGKHHFFLAKQKQIRENLAKHPKLDLTTWEEAQETLREAYVKTGYDPTA
jgi:hypothetical protein